MLQHLLRMCFLAGICWTLFLSGCKKQADESTQPVSKDQNPSNPNTPPKGKTGFARSLLDLRKTTNDFKQIVLAYHMYWDENRGKPPTKPYDFLPFLQKEGPRLTKAMKDGQIVVFFGATMQQMTEGTTNTILAYEKDADDKGLRVVAFGDGHLDTLNQADFDKKPKAKGK
jgi:hypothetical protein